MHRFRVQPQLPPMPMRTFKVRMGAEEASFPAGPRAAVFDRRHRDRNGRDGEHDVEDDVLCIEKVFHD